MPRNLLRRKPFCRKVQFMCTNLAPALPSVTRRKTKDPADPIKCAYLATAPKGRSENFFPLPLFQKLILFILFLLAFHHLELEERGGGGKKKYVFVPLPPGTEVLKVATKIGRPPFFSEGWRVGDGGFAFYGFFKPHIIPPEKEKVFCGGEACVLCLSSSCFRRKREGKKPKAWQSQPDPLPLLERKGKVHSSPPSPFLPLESPAGVTLLPFFFLGEGT